MTKNTAQATPVVAAFSAHCLHDECASPDLGVHETADAARSAASLHAASAGSERGHLTVVGTNRWDAKCFTEPMNLAVRTSAGAAIAAANAHRTKFPTHDVQVWEE